MFSLEELGAWLYQPTPITIVSLPFLCFSLAALIVYYLLPGRGQHWWLLLCSYFFYYSYNWRWPLILIALSLLNYLLLRPSMASGPRAGLGLKLALLVNLAPLTLFKIAEASGYTAGLKTGSFTGASGILDALALPMGLSFYTLQAISYQIDVRRGQAPAAPSFIGVALYLGYFPKLLAGPLERARAFLPQLAAARVLDDERVSRAAGLILMGLVRKMVIADPLATMIPPQVFEAPDSGSWLLLWLVVYSVSLYNDFAGYTSIVRGVSVLFGIDLSPNFANPFFARNFTEFWNRWHISLSHWLRDYVYMPISRSLLRRNPRLSNPVNILVPPMMSMLASGLWHGTGWHMLMWGGVHGLYLIGERIVSVTRSKKPIDRRPVAYRAAAIVGVSAAIMMANVFFRMSIGDAFNFLAAMLTPAEPSSPDPRPLILIALSAAIDWMQAPPRGELVFLQWSLLPRAALLAVVLLALGWVSQADTIEPFVYQGF